MDSTKQRDFINLTRKIQRTSKIKKNYSLTKNLILF